MSNIEIIKNPYNTNCDTWGCSNLGEFMIGKPGENLREHRIMCTECLQGIINAAPLGLILNRPELAVEDEEETTEEKLDKVGKALEGDLSDLSFKELKELATSKGLSFKVGMSTNDLIDYIKNK